MKNIFEDLIRAEELEIESLKSEIEQLKKLINKKEELQKLIEKSKNERVQLMKKFINN